MWGTLPGSDARIDQIDWCFQTLEYGLDHSKNSIDWGVLIGSRKHGLDSEKKMDVLQSLPIQQMHWSSQNAAHSNRSVASPIQAFYDGRRRRLPFVSKEG